VKWSCPSWNRLEIKRPSDRLRGPSDAWKIRDPLWFSWPGGWNSKLPTKAIAPARTSLVRGAWEEWAAEDDGTLWELATGDGIKS
jgi:hypothetical protein